MQQTQHALIETGIVDEHGQRIAGARLTHDLRERGHGGDRPAIDVQDDLARSNPASAAALTGSTRCTSRPTMPAGTS